MYWYVAVKVTHPEMTANDRNQRYLVVASMFAKAKGKTLKTAWYCRSDVALTHELKIRMKWYTAMKVTNPEMPAKDRNQRYMVVAIMLAKAKDKTL